MTEDGDAPRDSLNELIVGMGPPTDPSSIPVHFVRTADNTVLVFHDWQIALVLRPEHQSRLGQWLVRRVREDL